MKKLIALLLCVCLLLSAAACTNAPAVGKSTDASNQDGEQRLRIVATLQSLQINFWSNVQHTLERLAKEENVDLTIMDLNGDVTTFANVIDDIVAMKPDGVITCGLETSTLGIHVKTLQDAGIPVVTYNISPEGATCPPSIIQRAVSRCQDVTSDLSVYETNMNLLYDKLTALGFEVERPGGTFYIFPKALEEDANAFCMKAREFDLLLVPSDSFGVKGYVRLAYCIDTEKVKRSLPALEKLAAAYRK